MRFLALALFLLLALAQAPRPLLAGGEVGQALYPGGRGVSYGEVDLLARGLGLAVWQGEGQVALGLGSRYKAFPLVANEAQAAARGAAWKRGQEVLVPLRPLSEALGLEYRAQEGILVRLPWARLLGMTHRPDRVVLRFSREVNALVEGNSVLFLLAQGEGAGLSQEEKGLRLALESPPARLYYPGGGQVVLEWGSLVRPRPSVLLDPGHGGQDPGISAGGFLEKDLTLDLAKRVASRLPGARLTRQTDRYVPLEARLAQAQTASVMVSLHVTQGGTVNLYLPKARTSPLAQNAEALLATAPAEQTALLKVYAGDPGRLAQALQKAFSALGIVLARAEGPYALTDIPGAGVLLEVGVERLKTPEARNQVAEAIAQAIRTYVE
ncbi:N-acetylmuramoyl-L-alanine amidase family protein [Thermus caldifontis]|uniref:N-acetylmuramoyl-L-alanine amidase family protein n=1 Tax=Thermus caldifontis TaxID=1930763 RepID=UPI000DF1E6FA|nr:N-acetylmuramoyl-L-alanine amidase [Thermus caldifontis]